MSAKIMCVDDSPTIRMLVKQNLVPEGFDIVEATDGQDGLNKLSSDIALFLVDVNMPVMNGIETTEWIVENYPQVHVMALSVEDADGTILKMLKAGAVGYLLKDTKKEILEKALLEMMDNGFYHTKNVTTLLLDSVSGKKERNNLAFKENEITFMKLACSELTYKEIADKMFLSPKTIDGYRDSLFTKLNVRNRVGLVMYAIKNKIYTP